MNFGFLMQYPLEIINKYFLMTTDNSSSLKLEKFNASSFARCYEQLKA